MPLKAQLLLFVEVRQFALESQPVCFGRMEVHFFSSTVSLKGGILAGSLGRVVANTLLYFSRRIRIRTRRAGVPAISI
jgi:hypothetical protein